MVNCRGIPNPRLAWESLVGHHPVSLPPTRFYDVLHMDCAHRLAADQILTYNVSHFDRFQVPGIAGWYTALRAASWAALS